MKTQIAAIAKALRCGLPFYAYREPNSNLVHFSASNKTLEYTAEGNFILPHEKGFLIYPFSVSQNTPIVFIPNTLSVADVLAMPENSKDEDNHISGEDANYDTYKSELQKCMSLFENHKVDKIVISRTITNTNNYIDWSNVYARACEQYTSAFVFIYYIPNIGGWFGASPELLLKSDNGKLMTMALASTRKAGTLEEWGDKEVEEQKFVSDYINNIFLKQHIPFSRSKTYTRKAASIEHLCTDFETNTANVTNVLHLLSELNPTPAVCGIPKNDAKEAIIEIETHKRKYYSGYIGELNGKDFAMYVNLRSLEFDDYKYRLYIGGGITAHSDIHSEWNETEAKSHTLNDILHQ